jgi:hypothetical protein
MRKSIRAEERTFRRDPVFDRLLTLLFPEMTQALAARALKLQEPGLIPLRDTPRWAVWLRGRDLEEWRRRQPNPAPSTPPKPPKVGF